MVNNLVHYKVKIDKQGRIVIPSEVRKKLGLKPNSELILVVRDNSILIEPEETDIEKIIDEWYEYMLKMKTRARGLTIEPSKWMSDEYVKRKLGID